MTNYKFAGAENYRIDEYCFSYKLIESIMKKLIRLLILSVFLTSAISTGAQTVFVNKSDSKYHLLSCIYLDPNHDSLDMAFAIKKGLGPCSVCKPSAQGASSSGSMGTPNSMGAAKSMGTPKSMEKSGMNQKANSSANAAGKQCAFIDKDGKRCTGEIETGSAYCMEHRNYKK